MTVLPLPDRIPPEIAAQRALVLKSIRIEGATLLPNDVFAPLWADMVGREIPVSALYDLTDRIERLYREAGILSLAVVPDQDLSDGDVRIVVYDQSYLETVEIMGNDPDIGDRLAPYIDKLVAMQPLRIKEIERILLVMSDLAGMNIDATLRRPDTLGKGGSAILEIAFEKRSLQLLLDNRGTKEIGPVQAFASYQENDLFGLFESTSLTFATTPNSPERLLLGQIAQDFPIGWNGLHAGYQFGVTNSKPGGALEELDLNVGSISSDVYASYPVLRTIDHTIALKTGLTTRNTDVDIGPDRLTSDRYRWFSFGVDADHDIGIGPLSVQTEFLQGIRPFNATDEGSPLASRAIAETDFQVVTANARLLVDLFGGLSLLGRGSGQLAFGPLPSVVQMSLGGDPFGRAFETAAASGDSGIAGSLELALDTGLDFGVVRQSAAYTFIDYGVVGLRGSDSIGVGNTSLGSTGVGFRAFLDQGFAIDTTIAIPFEADAAVRDYGTQIFFSVKKRF
ncbi:MAG: ShlB/FhaC/HecB family hemolysin secretion/activation protein [Rhodospirillaceae bacterium]|nr:ShlB/FhaC/HecB family hemolysin secretion/activation protein [Rhodospirillaceae bacterium]